MFDTVSNQFAEFQFRFIALGFASGVKTYLTACLVVHTVQLLGSRASSRQQKEKNDEEKDKQTLKLQRPEIVPNPPLRAGRGKLYLGELSPKAPILGDSSKRRRDRPDTQCFALGEDQLLRPVQIHSVFFVCRGGVGRKLSYRQ